MLLLICPSRRVITALLNLMLTLNEVVANNTPIDLQQREPKLDFTKTDHAGLSAELLSTDWSNVFSANDCIDDAWNAFSAFIISLIQKFTPVKSPFVQTNSCNSLPFSIQSIIRNKKQLGKFIKNIIENKIGLLFAISLTLYASVLRLTVENRKNLSLNLF